MPNYKRPPITEAVVELRFVKPISESQVESCRKKLVSFYPFYEAVHNVNVNLDVDPRNSSVVTHQYGWKFASLDQVNVAIVRRDTFVSSRLAPYSGWDELLQRTERDWQAVRKIMGAGKIGRIGVRFINRLDIPTDGIEAISLKDYLNFYPQLPGMPTKPVTSFNMQTTLPVSDDVSQVTINSASIESPLPKHASFVLDIDISQDRDIPLKDDGIWVVINKYRGIKNSIFEACVTDASRKLFDR